MKHLMMRFGRSYPLMAEATGTEGGGGGGGGNPPPATDPAPPPATDPAPPPTTGHEHEVPVAVAQPPVAQPSAAQPPAEIKPEDYVPAMRVDEGLAADVEIDADCIQALAPTLKELGIRPADANRLANELARYQVERWKESQRQRVEDNRRMCEAARQKYTKGEFDQINAAIDRYFDPKGTMNYIIRNSELGNDPEFLALMAELGSRLPTNGGASGAGAGGTGGSSGNPDGYSGISGLWK